MKLIDKIKVFIYPERCPYCRTIVDFGQIACDNCKKDFPKDYIKRGIPGGYRCVSAFEYKGKYQRAIINFKFKNKTQHAFQLANILLDELNKNYGNVSFDLITYVPLHKKDLLIRGYNQSELLAKELSKLTGIKCISTIRKVKHTKKQHTLKYKDRKENLKGAFMLNDSKHVKEKTVLLIDDVVTTGTTLAVCCKTISKAKPKGIYCMTLSSVSK